MKFRIVTLFSLVLVSTLILSGCRFWGGKPAATPTPTPKPPEKINVIPVAERPYVALAPNGTGKEVVLQVYDVKKPAPSAEYEIEYDTNGLVQGAFGKFATDALPITKNILLGSCSAGGKCTYHENVTGGKLLLRFGEGTEKYVLKTEWSYLQNKEKGTFFAARDGKFSLDGKGLTKVTHVILFQSPGLPENTSKTLLSAIYAPRFAGTSTGEVTVKIRLNEDVASASILGWDGKVWHELKAAVADQTATVKSPLYEAFVAVSAQ